MKIQLSLAVVASLSLLGCPESPPASTTGDAATATATSATASATASAAAEPVKAGKVFFVTPLDGAQVFPEVDVNMGTENREIVAAGSAAGDASKGHFWVFVDDDAPPKGTKLTADDTHVAFAKGEKVGSLTGLSEGKHKLTLLLADAEGKAYGPELSQTVAVEVVAAQGEAKVDILEPKDGATVKPKFTVKFGVEGMPIKPAGEAPKDRTSGHHHLLVNMGAMPPGEEIPNDATHKHYGKGQTEVEVELAPGDYELTAQFADGSHRSYGEKLAKTIKITVAE